MRIGVIAWIGLASCAPNFDSTRQPASGSFGEHVVELMCTRLAYEADPTDVSGDHFRDACKTGAVPPDASPALAGLLGDRDRLIKAIDAAVPDDFTQTLQGYLSGNDVLALYDDGGMSTSVASLADLLDEVAGDDAALAALARLGTRDGYRPSATAGGAPGAMTAMPSMNDMLAQVLPAITAGGVAHGEWDSLVAALAATLSDVSAPPDAASAQRTAALAAQLLLTERADISEPQPLLLVRRDPRGVAVPAVLAAPLVDQDGDGLADVDAVGRYVDASGMPTTVAAPFAVAGDSAMRDPAGRALDGGGAAFYRYVDVGKTVAGALGHDAAALLDPNKGTALDLARGASALLGARVMATHAFSAGPLEYRGYDTTQSPLLDIAYGYMQVLRDPNIYDLLALTDTVVANHTSAAARLSEAIIAAARVGNSHPEAQVDPMAPMWDDMTPVLRQILSRPALVSALLTAMERPEVKELSKRFAEQMTYSDRFDIDPSTQKVTGSFTVKPDRTKVDNAYNRSLFQRLLHVINDSNGAQSCNKQGAVVKDPVVGITLATYNQCALFKVDNLAVFYLQSIAYAKDAQGRIICEDSKGAFGSTQVVTSATQCAGIGAGWRPRPKANFNYQWGGTVSSAINLAGGDGFVEGQATITGMRTHPTPEALNRVLFLNPTPAFLLNVIDPLRDRDGDLFNSQHAGTLPVWEKNNFYEEIRPIVQAFADNNSEQLMVDLLAAMHKHWPSKDSITTQHTDPSGANYAWAGNAKTYEPLMIEVFGGDLMAALSDLAPELNAITANGKAYATIWSNAGTFFLTPLPGLADRQGRTSSTTSDGKPVTVLSPWQLLADAYVGKTARLAQTAGEGQAWLDSTAEVVDVLFRASKVGTTWGFRNGHVAAVTRAMLAFTRGRLTAHDTAGDRVPWLAQTLPRNTQDLLTHPLFAGVADLATSLSADTAARAALDSVVHDAFEEVTSPGSAAAMRTAFADLVQLAADDADLVPIAHMAGGLLTPGKSYLPTQLDFMKRLRTADSGNALVTLVSHVFAGYDTTDPGVSALGAIDDAIGEVHRVSPEVDAHAAWTPADFASVLHGVAGFLREQQRGLPRFIAIVAGRNP